MRLDGKVAVITGASMGIGEAMAKLFVEEGARVVLSSRDEKRIEEARTRVGRPEKTLGIFCDVRNREDLDRLLSLTLHNFGRIDIWVNNAGFGLRDTIAAVPMRECRNMFETNLFGAIEGIQVAAPVMVKQGSGTIVNVSSVAGHVPVPGMGAYCATKFALNAIGKAARMELASSGVRVMTVCPGYIETNFARNVVRGSQAGKFDPGARTGATAEQVARATLNGYLKGKREVVVPWFYSIAIKFYQLIPGVVENYMSKRLATGK
ncbi:MAG TPA: SDR family NAD(P)-dependent oxidoreductase [Terriglobales bacterium]|nr:SDR family NAD(P)-dependent oxidoreductase [Terriglobales bacterium]